MAKELRLAARRLIRERWTTLTAVLTVALGAGLTMAVFAVGYSLLLRPLAYDPAGRLSLVDVRTPATQIDDWRSRLSVFDRLIAYAAEGLVISGGGDTRLVRGAYVDDDFFEVLHARPAAGRVLVRGETGVAVLSERFVRASGRSADAWLGRQILAGDSALTVVGVLPEHFAFPAANSEIWIPARHARPIVFDRSPDARRFRLAGWLRPGVSPATAAGEVDRVQRELQPDAREPSGLRVEGAHAAVTRDVRSTVLVCGAAAGLLWVVTCANLASILVGRTIRRRRELAVCHALGAGRWRRAVSVLSEAALITIAGTLVGVLLAVAAMHGATVWAAELLPRPGEIRFDAAPAVFAAVSSTLLVLTATLLALPALRRRTLELHARQAGATTGDRRLRSVLLVSQVALVVVLLCGGALLVRTLAGLLRTDIGLDAHDALVTQLVLTPSTAYHAGDRWPMLRALLDRIRVVPGVRFAGAGSSLPPDNAQIEISVRFTDHRGGQSHRFSTALVTPGYLEAIGARLVDGRFFQEADLAGAPQVILSESAAKAVLYEVRAAGRELPFSLPGVSDRRRPEVAGVIADIRYSGLDAPPDAAVYVPWHLAPLGQGFLAVGATGAAARAQVVSSIRAAMREVDSTLPHMPIRTFGEVVERSIGIRRVAAFVGAMLALLALALALIGLVGSVLRSIEERRRELAIRSALGASSAQLVRLIASSVVVLTAIGFVLGLAGALATERVLRAIVAGVRSYDAATLAAVAALVMTASFAASYLPARLAARVNAAEVLKADD